MKKTILTLLMCIALIVTLIGCQSKADITDSGKLNIVVTGFVQYDITKSIVKDLCSVSMLIKPGSEVHTYEPTPSDIMKIQSADLFICTGGESDNWTHNILEGNDKLRVVRLMDLCNLYHESFSQGMQGAHQHTHNDAHNHESYEGFDEHVWTSPRNVIKIAEGLREILCEIDNANKDLYSQNASSFTQQLSELDSELCELVRTSKRNTIVVGDRFPFVYLANDYNLEYFAAFPGCASNTEPSAKTVMFLIDKVKKEKIPVIFSKEFSNGKIAQAISLQTSSQMLTLHSCSNVTADEFSSGETYITLMQKNIINLRKALN